MRYRKFIAPLIGLICLAAFLVYRWENGHLLTTKQAHTYELELVPLVEKAVGKKFKSIPPIKVVEPKEFIPIYAESIIKYQQSSTKITKSIQRAAWAKARDLINNSFGFYDRVHKTIYLMPSNLNRRIKNQPGRQYDLKLMQKMVIAHELAHALRHQCIDITEIPDASVNNTLDYADALDAVKEGHACYIQEQVAELSDQYEVIEQFREVQGLTEEGLYSAAVDFFAYQHKKSGIDGVWQALKHPPIRTYMIFHPEMYSPDGKRLCNFSEIMRGLEKNFGLINPKVEMIDNGEWTLRRFYNFIAPGLHQRLFAKPVDSKAMIICPASSECRDALSSGSTVITVVIYVISNHQVIPEFTDAMIKGEIKRESTKDNPKKVKRATYNALADFKLDMDRRYDFEQMVKGKISHESWLFAAKGSVMVRIVGANIKLSDKQVRSAVEQIFDRMPAHLLYASARFQSRCPHFR